MYNLLRGFYFFYAIYWNSNFFFSYLPNHCIKVPIKTSFLGENKIPTYQGSTLSFFKGWRNSVRVSKSSIHPGSHLKRVYCVNISRIFVLTEVFLLTKSDQRSCLHTVIQKLDIVDISDRLASPPTSNPPCTKCTYFSVNSSIVFFVTM